MIQSPDLSYEHHLWAHFKHVAGLDEAGRGALAGPVAVGAVILPDDETLLSQALAGVRDSKQMTPLERQSFAPRIKEIALAWSVAFASAGEIDTLGIVRATRTAAIRALNGLSIPPQYLLTDFRLELPHLDISQTSIVKGDARCLSIASASVLAKTARDEVMRELDSQYPNYGLGKHKGYGTQAHRSALKRLGYSSVHRKTFVLKENSLT
ncbi:MAG: ribonuclease HII [Chloroflexi bacterium]|nr:ribonuclease HII [Chloroflexota bacterium]